MDGQGTPSEQLSSDLHGGTEKIRVSTPNQMFLGTLLGGPLAGIYLLGKNFKAMGEDRKARMMWFLGPLLVLGFFLILFFFAWPILRGLPMISALIAHRISFDHQMNKPEILASTTHKVESNWEVTAVVFLSIFVSGVLLYLLADLFLRFQGY